MGEGAQKSHPASGIRHPAAHVLPRYLGTYHIIYLKHIKDAAVFFRFHHEYKNTGIPVRRSIWSVYSMTRIVAVGGLASYISGCLVDEDGHRPEKNTTTTQDRELDLIRAQGARE